MCYLITSKCYPPAVTPWFDPENHFNPDVEMVVYDLQKLKYMDDGHTWKDIEEDHL
jgi:hypothetical protein